MPELSKFKLKISVISNGLEKYMGFNISNKLSFINSFQFISPSLAKLAKKLNKDDFKYLSHEFHNNVLDLVQQKVFNPYDYMSDIEMFKWELPHKEKFVCSLTWH